MNCKCFRCGASYGSDNPDDIAGDGRCKDCVELGKKTALKVDIEIAEKRRLNPPQVNKRAELIQDLIKNGGQINARDLGIERWGS